MGQRLNFKADQDLGHIERVAKFVNRRSDDISAGAAVATTKLSVLVAMNIADDYFNDTGYIVAVEETNPIVYPEYEVA